LEIPTVLALRTEDVVALQPVSSRIEGVVAVSLVLSCTEDGWILQLRLNRFERVATVLRSLDEKPATVGRRENYTEGARFVPGCHHSSNANGQSASSRTTAPARHSSAGRNVRASLAKIHRDEVYASSD
jgi:hypothetical protein